MHMCCRWCTCVDSAHMLTVHMLTVYVSKVEICVQCMVPSMSRFLLGHHKAALDSYAEASTLDPNDWV